LTAHVRLAVRARQTQGERVAAVELATPGRNEVDTARARIDLVREEADFGRLREQRCDGRKGASEDAVGDGDAVLDVDLERIERGEELAAHDVAVRGEPDVEAVRNLRVRLRHTELREARIVARHLLGRNDDPVLYGRGIHAIADLRERRRPEAAIVGAAHGERLVQLVARRELPEKVAAEVAVILEAQCAREQQ